MKWSFTEYKLLCN